MDNRFLAGHGINKERLIKKLENDKKRRQAAEDKKNKAHEEKMASLYELIEKNRVESSGNKPTIESVTIKEYKEVIDLLKKLYALLEIKSLSLSELKNIKEDIVKFEAMKKKIEERDKEILLEANILIKRKKNN